MLNVIIVVALRENIGLIIIMVVQTQLLIVLKLGTGGLTMTNYERIKQMSVEEMASYFCIGGLPICPLHAPHCKDDKCPECFKKWLESEVDDNG